MFPASAPFTHSIGFKFTFYSFHVKYSGAQDDLRKVTEMASKQIQELGMSDKIGHLSFPKQRDGGKPYSKALQQVIDQVK